MKKILFVISIMASMFVLCGHATALNYQPFSNNNIDYSYSYSTTSLNQTAASTSGSSYKGGYSVDLINVEGRLFGEMLGVKDILPFGYDGRLTASDVGEDGDILQRDSGTGLVDTPLSFPHFLFAFMFVGYTLLLVRRKVKSTQHQ